MTKSAVYRSFEVTQIHQNVLYNLCCVFKSFFTQLHHNSGELTSREHFKTFMCMGKEEPAQGEMYKANVCRHAVMATQH